jgi:hypothetical protein
VTEGPRYTDEVRKALATQAAQRADDQPPAPEGMVRYHIAVEQTVLNGMAAPKTVAANLRAIADQIDPPQGDPA